LTKLGQPHAIATSRAPPATAEYQFRAVRVPAGQIPASRLAVHLACALHLEGDDILLATWDNALNTAARATGQLITNDTG
jgi:hypothetical protein